jgi:hypothetical protein
MISQMKLNNLLYYQHIEIQMIHLTNAIIFEYYRIFY